MYLFLLFVPFNVVPGVMLEYIITVGQVSVSKLWPFIIFL